MRKATNMVEYQAKGELEKFEDNLLEVIKHTAKEEIPDSIAFDELLSDVTEFCKVHTGKEIECKFLIKVSEEE